MRPSLKLKNFERGTLRSIRSRKTVRKKSSKNRKNPIKTENRMQKKFDLDWKPHDKRSVHIEEESKPKYEKPKTISDFRKTTAAKRKIRKPK